MSYDFHGAFSETTGINSPLYDQGWGEEDFNVHDCVSNWVAGGASRSKINTGLAFYGRSMAGATGLNQPHSGADRSAWGIDDGTPQYYNILDRLPDMTTVWDSKTWTPYSFFPAGGLVSYDNEASICLKVQYALENDLNGFIVWELSGDLMRDLSTPLLDMTNTKLRDPSFDCGQTGLYPEADDTSISSSPTASPIPKSPTLIIGTPPTMQPSNTPGSFPDNTQLSSSDQPVKETAQPPNVTNLPYNNQIAGQPIEQGGYEIEHSADVPSVYEQPQLFVCEGRPAAFDADDSRVLDLSFRYELHSRSDVHVSDALVELKKSMLDGLSKLLNCDTGFISAARGIRGNRFETIQEEVLAIESEDKDGIDNDGEKKCAYCILGNSGS